MMNIDKTKYQRLSWIRCISNLINIGKGSSSFKITIKYEILIESAHSPYINSNDDNFRINFSCDNMSFAAIIKNNTTSYKYIKLEGINNVYENTFEYDVNNGYRYIVNNITLNKQRTSEWFTDQSINSPNLLFSTNNIYSKIYYVSCWSKATNKTISYYPVKQLSDNTLGFYSPELDNYVANTSNHSEGDPIENTLDLSKVNKIVIPEGNVLSITKDGEEDPLWSAKNSYAYGVRWDCTNDNPLERIGNINLHKTLPIQNQFKRCVYQGDTIQYYLNEQDSRFVSADIRENFIYHGTEMNITACDGLPSNIISCEEKSTVKCKFVNKTLFSNYRFLYSYVYVKSNENTNNVAIGRIVHIDTDKGEAYIDDSDELQKSSYVYDDQESYQYYIYEIVNEEVTDFTEDCTVELGASLNGFDGEVGVDTGKKWYLWSVNAQADNEAIQEVWMSQYKCVPYAREVPRMIIGMSNVALYVKPYTDGLHGWIGKLPANSLVNVISYDSNLSQREDSSNPFLLYNVTTQKGIDKFRSYYCKSCDTITLDLGVNYITNTNSVSPNHYLMDKATYEAINWAYIIEYANFDVNDTYNSALLNGCKQGGLGTEIKNVLITDRYNDNNVVPLDYTLHLGNNTGLVEHSSINFNAKTSVNDITKYALYNCSKKSSTSNSVTIGQIGSVKTYNLQAPYQSVSGTIKYTISGLTDGQTVIFKRDSGYLTITADGAYNVDWGHGTTVRQIVFGKVQTSCNITITLNGGSNLYYSDTIDAFSVPSWRGFNGWFTNCNAFILASVLMKTSNNKLITYYTDKKNCNSNDINDYEHKIEAFMSFPTINICRSLDMGKDASMIYNLGGKNRYIGLINIMNISNANGVFIKNKFITTVNTNMFALVTNKMNDYPMIGLMTCIDINS